MNRKKIKEMKKLKDEIEYKKLDLEEKKVRLNGGFSKTLKKEIISCSEEIDRLNRIIEMRNIELEKNKPSNPKYEYESDERWMEIKKYFDSEELERMQEHLKRVEEQKTQILKDIPVLEEQIKELEKKTKPDYVG